MQTHATAAALPDPIAQPEFYEGVPTKRFLAWVIDALLICAFCVVALILTLGIGFFFLPALVLVVGLAYRIATLARGSATWGMALMAIELRRHDGSRLDPMTAALHSLGYAASMTFVLPQIASVVLMLITERRQGLSDIVLGTAMVNRAAGA
ncbi:RDD family protein [Roseovarius aquimarinus]|uniref:RDD family protein n=1 Tax=Roseovarius aquimarinus TaxID=1229156 RepID=A0ABW7I3D2_9RHOB